ncbi:hypothetical protein HZF24_06810 [Sedimentibacter hydroxybenzoicus DSM 7310]|uniref:Uncharacterized protein n=1 Tax=Sedimentibacter hydroxybenzoicus DSM 7310 TaxID=1123245 RepID=A0A974BIL2_SEDHY|nr:hypothetical protein [Sedimentibacter hydroxybenzoicus]NYB73848.1 hypothetical protein [Sedimentibacter hydroxybenzoicus DSM 7310]
MYILSDLEGNLIQFGNFNTDIDNRILEMSEAFDKEIIGTEDEELCNKALLYNSFKLKVVNGVIFDVMPVESVIPEPSKEPTIEDYLVDLDFRVSLIELGV